MIGTREYIEEGFFMDEEGNVSFQRRPNKDRPQWVVDFLHLQPVGWRVDPKNVPWYRSPVGESEPWKSIAMEQSERAHRAELRLAELEVDPHREEYECLNGQCAHVTYAHGRRVSAIGHGSTFWTEADSEAYEAQMRSDKGVRSFIIKGFDATGMARGNFINFWYPDDEA